MDFGELFYLATPQLGGTSGGEKPPSDDEPEQPKVKVRLSLFFDGTLNNRMNTTHRLKSSATYKENKKETSYINDYSNVSRLEEKVKGHAAGYDYYVKVYTEGIGTTNSDSDTLVGMVTGRLGTGVFAKVEKGLLDAVARVCKVVPAGTVIEKLTVDTFGFSRGAAAARYCVHRVLHDEEGTWSTKANLADTLTALDRSVEQVEVHAVGLFDTVSALGLPSDTSGVAELKLNAIREAKAVLQLAAAEEYRRNFSLTNIDSAGGKGHQFFLPGAHSDIGGAYREGDSEQKKIMDGSNSPAIRRFLRDYGWCREDEIRYHRGTAGDAVIEEYVGVNRRGISQEYSFIPLRIMADFATEQALTVDETLYSVFNPVNVPGELRSRIDAYVAAKGKSENKDWQTKDPLLCTLRHDFLHLSCSASTGMTMRTKHIGNDWENVVPTRLVFSG